MNRARIPHRTSRGGRRASAWNLLVVVAVFLTAAAPCCPGADCGVGDNERFVGLPGGATAVLRGPQDCLPDAIPDGDDAGRVSIVRRGDAGTCRWEVAVFSVDRGFGFLTSGMMGDWSGSGFPLALPPLVDVPVKVWVVDGSQEDAGIVATDVDRASEAFASSRSGITITLAEVARVRPSSPAGSDCGQTMGEWAVPESGYYAPDTVNVYIKQSHTYGFSGRNCFQFGFPNVILIYMEKRKAATLAHELGHALMLRDDCGHVDDNGVARCPSIDAGNIMWNGDVAGYVRDRFTLGQGYRMNVESGSFINLAGLRAGAVKHCQENCWTTACGLDRPCARISLDLPGASQ